MLIIEPIMTIIFMSTLSNFLKIFDFFWYMVLESYQNQIRVVYLGYQCEYHKYLNTWYE